MRTVGVKSPIVTVWRVVVVMVWGTCVDVHAADFVIDSDCLAWSPTTSKKCCCKELAISLSTGHKDYIRLFRIHVSRKAALKAKAVLEGLRLDQSTIDACISAHPLNDEEIVQDGLTRWCGGKGTQPPTWNVLIDAMDYADIAQQDIEELKRKLGH